MSEIAAQDAPPRASRSLDITSAEARARIRKRYRAEARFRAYGLMAVGFAGLFLVVLIGSILMRGLPAFWVSKLEIPVTLTADDIDPGKTGDPAEIAKGNFAAPIRDALLAKFPEAADRAARRKLSGLVSSGAADELRRRAMADPSLIGTSITVPLLLSDDADLYLRGPVATLDVASGRGTATPSGAEGAIEVVSTEPDFLAHLQAVKSGLDDQMGKARREIGALDERLAEYDSLIRGLQAQVASTAGDTSILQRDLDKAKTDRETLGAQRSQLDAKLVDLKTRVGAPQAPEVIDATVPSLLLRLNGGLLKVTSVAGNTVEGDVIVPLASVAPATPGTWSLLGIDVPEADRRVSDQEILWLEDLKAQGAIHTQFNWAFFASGDSREPELAGILGGLVGSLLTLFVTLVICLPIGVAAAVYLEEFAPKNRLTSLIEVNINNLAAVPSIVFGLLGLAVFLNFFGMPRSSALVGGLVLALLVLPTIIIASRAALKAVPPSIREGALGVGASHQQAVFHHVLPLAMPGILTGTIIGMAHALGETAPLLMIGMIAFIVDVPSGFTQAATALPVQIFLWSDLPEVAFQAKTSAAIIVLLVFLFVMNGAAIILRRRFERRW